MSFKLVLKKNDTDENFMSNKDFFKNIKKDVDNSSPIQFDMDTFMLCLILGLKENKKENVGNYKLDQTFSSNYIESYKKVKPVITALLLSKILSEKNIDKNEKDEIKKNLQEFLNTNDSTFLSNKSFEVMYSYYLGGFNILLKKFNYKAPDEVSIFFDKYNKLLSD